MLTSDFVLATLLFKVFMSCVFYFSWWCIPHLRAFNRKADWRFHACRYHQPLVRLTDMQGTNIKLIGHIRLKLVTDLFISHYLHDFLVSKPGQYQSIFMFNGCICASLGITTGYQILLRFERHQALTKLTYCSRIWEHRYCFLHFCFLKIYFKGGSIKLTLSHQLTVSDASQQKRTALL